ncbi:hypothetical protein BsWGS_13045 [Bradybaena similaris]
MMHQDTTSLAALEVTSHVLYDNTVLPVQDALECDANLPPVSHATEGKDAGSLTRKGKSPSGRTARVQKTVPQTLPRHVRKTKEDVRTHVHAPSTIVRKADKRGTSVVVRLGADQSDNSDLVTDHVHPQSTNGAKKYLTDTNRKPARHHNETIAAELTSGALSAARPTRKLTKSALRRFKRNLAQKSAGLEERVPVEMSPTEQVGNKAENNNWMLDNEEDPNSQGGCVVPTLHTRSCAPGLNSFIQPKSDCNAASKITPAENTCDVSSLPRDSSNLRGDCNLEKCSPKGKLVNRPAGSPDLPRVPRNVGVCVSCGSDIHTPKYSLCKHCGVRNRPDENRNGPLDELKTYAQNFANSVKKILLSSPVLELSEIVQNLTPEGAEEKSAKAATQEEAMPWRSGPELCLNRYMTEINMGSRSEIRSRSLLSKSMSYDGRVGSIMDEKDSRSPTHWISHGRDKASDSFPKMSDSRLKHVDADYFITGKEEKQLPSEVDKNRVNKADKFKAKGSNKQMARVERARTDGDLRTNTAEPTILSKKHVKDESKRGYEFQRNRSKTFHELDAGSDEQGICSPYREAEADIKISRLKVIHEGSPVDPPNAADGKKYDEGKARKALFIRSATAPYKNHQSRKEIATSLAGLDGAERISRTNTKITVRTNKASTLRKENSLSDRRKVPDMLEAYDDDGSVMHLMSYIKGRSTSYDGSQAGPKRDELPRSSSWSVIDGNDEEVKNRKESSPTNYVNRRKQQTGLSVNGGPPSRFRVSDKVEYQLTDDISVDPFLYSELPMDTFKQSRREAGVTELAAGSPQERSRYDNEVQLQQMQSQNEHTFEVEPMYYDDGARKRLSPCIEQEEEDQKIIEDLYVEHFNNESYYTENPPATNQTEAVDNVMQVDRYNDKSDFKSVGEDEAIYHDEINKYVSSDIADDKNSMWYSPPQVLSQDDRSLARRGRSLESKSTTSFHIVARAKSSHSDEAISKYSGVLDHALSRRLSMYTESDVDTGLVYHLATRQMTRAHVPPYHDLTTGSREIYTMSGDVSRSTSSNSANSNRSELSECAYTGGFYKDDPFYDNASKGSRSSSSQESASNIYFESTGVSKRELSELDIYTGSIFNSNQNTMPSSHVAGTENPVQETFVKDGRIMASARAGIGRMQRSVRCRPRVDVMTFRSNDSAWEYFSQSLVICGETRCCNVSNNSSNWYNVDEFDSSSCSNCAVITKSADPMYTDYDPGTRPEFNVKNMEKSGASMFDFMKYDNSGDPNKAFMPPRRDDSGSDSSIWYSGLLSDQNIEEVEIPTCSSHHSVDRSPFAWQHNDDYYKSSVRPIVKNKTNNCSYRESSSIPGDANNNHFDDIYTGSYGAQNIPPPPQEQAQPVRPPPTENWYVKQPSPTYTSSTLYDQKYESCYTVQGPPRKSASEVYETVRDPYSTYAQPNKVFSNEPPKTTESSVYMVDDGWYKYGPKISSPMDEQQPRRPEKPPNREPESYFKYASKVSPERSFYVIDDETYSFEPKVEAETPATPVVKEIKTVGGIVCRENVANKDDYAEDINRDLEPGAWVPFTFRRDDDTKYPQDTAGSHDKQEAQRSSDVSGTGPNSKYSDDMYANNRLYDNVGARKNWQRTQAKPDSGTSRSRDSSQHRAFQSGDTGKQDQSKNRSSADIIPDKARGKRSVSNVSKTAATENSCSTNKGSGSSTASKNRRR